MKSLYPETIEDLRNICEKEGYGWTLHQVELLWVEFCKRRNLYGSNIVLGPCEASTTPCGCELNRYDCDWCEGAGWLTHLVKTLKDKS